MPDDLLEFVSGPTPYSSWWLWLGVALLLLVIAFYVGVVVWTLPSSRLRTMRGVRGLHARMLRRRFARSVRDTGAQYRAGELSATEAGARMSRTLRSFLHQATGAPVQYMHVDAIGAGKLAAAAPVFSALNDAQFNTVSPVDVNEIGATTEELILSWP